MEEKYKVYIETPIPSYLIARRSNDLRIMANQNITKALKNIPKLKVTEDSRFLAQAFLDSGTIPAQAQIDAYHIAVTAVNGGMKLCGKMRLLKKLGN